MGLRIEYVKESSHLHALARRISDAGMHIVEHRRHQTNHDGDVKSVGEEGTGLTQRSCLVHSA